MANKETKVMSNKEFAEKNEHFLAACEAINVKPTSRQASKFRNEFGSAYLVGRLKAK